MKKNNGKLKILIVAAIVTTILVSACSPKETKNSASDEFKVGMECAYAPFNWTQNDDSNGAVPIGDGTFANGYDVQIAKKIATGLNKKLVIVKTEWDGLPPAIMSGKIDAIIAGMSATKERKQVLDFTDNYYTSDIVIVVKKDSTYANAKSINDFSGAKITGQLNTVHYTLIDQMKGAKKEVALSDFPTMIVSLNSGSIDGYISERPGALAAVTTNPNLTFVSFEKGKGFTYDEDESAIAVGLKKGSAYVAPINEILKGISSDERTKLMQDVIKNQPVNKK